MALASSGRSDDRPDRFSDAEGREDDPRQPELPDVPGDRLDQGPAPEAAPDQPTPKQLAEAARKESYAADYGKRFTSIAQRQGATQDYMGEAQNNPGLIKNLDGSSNPAEVDPRLPTRATEDTAKDIDKKTSGILQLRDRNNLENILYEVGLISQENGAGSMLPGKPVRQSWTHVEFHAVATLNASPDNELYLFINNQEGPCRFCRSLLVQKIDPGNTLHVIWVDGLGMRRISTFSRAAGEETGALTQGQLPEDSPLFRRKSADDD